MLYAMNQLSITFRNSELALGWCIAPPTTKNSGWMRVVIEALIALAVANAYGAEFLNSDFKDLKSRLVSTWSEPFLRLLVEGCLELIRGQQRPVLLGHDLRPLDHHRCVTRRRRSLMQTQR